VFESASAEATEAVGAALASELRDGDVVFLTGELGAGKTTLVRGAARALGAEGAVTSPTFAIGHRYPAAQLLVTHLDLYRLASLDTEDPDLLAPYVGPGRICFVEWAERGGTELGPPRLHVELRHAGNDERTIEVRSCPPALRDGGRSNG
jgi:tRNA threonylcarbamoyladenosine biosynthesis protein TsaE